MRRLADRRVVHVQIAADGAHDHLARVQPDADADRHAVLRGAPPRRTASPTPASAAPRSTPAPRGPRGPAGAPNSAMIPSPITWLTVPSYRCTASIMCSSTGSRSLRASSGSRSASSSIEPLRSAKSTVTCLRSPSRAALGGEDLLGEVLRGVAVGRARRYRRTAQRLTAAVTEAARGWIHLPARGADRLQPTATPVTESRAGGVLVSALGTEHQPATARTKRSTSASSL